jgi:hypothetical protein
MGGVHITTLEKSSKGRFPAGEAAIAKDAVDAYFYAAYVIKGRFPEGEAAIAKSAEYAYWYADYIGRRFPEGEANIARSEWREKYERLFNFKF